MVEEVSTTQSSQTIDERVVSVLRSASTFQSYEKLLKGVGVQDPNPAFLGLEVFRLVQGKKNASSFIQVLKDELSLSDVQARTLAISIGADLLLPLNSFLSIPVGTLMKEWGSSSDASQELSPETSVTAYVSSLPGVEDERMRHRFISILVHYAKEDRSREETKLRLMEPISFNGLGFDEALAEQVLSDFDKSHQEKRLQKKQQITEVSQAPVIETFTQEDATELAQVQTRTSDILNEKGPADIPSMVNDICKDPSFHFEEPVLQDRCRTLIESRVREVRDAVQVRSQLERSIDKGGLGVSGRRLADLLERLEHHVEVYQSLLAKEQKQEQTQEQEAVQMKKEEKAQALEQHAQKEEQVLSKRYISLTGKMPTERVLPVAPPMSRTSAAISAQHELLQHEGKIDVAKVRAVVEQARDQRPVASQPIGRPTMQEVTFIKRLSGPLDELRALTLVDFRRLSRDPIQSAMKVKDKVDLMEEQGYDKKVEAVAAWRSSPVNQLYVQLTREAVLKGISVKDLLFQKREQKQETFSDEELNALMQLNADLRF
ncbi:hypothetical protein HYV70_01465 [Candidatus Uhrbacteria bacterium]|nr:hypothetical protein [Candidatus Uhrbacteria bacterium]